MNKYITTIAAFGFAAIAGSAFAQSTPTAAPSGAGSTWAQNHPRRAEVNGRLANQNARIHQDVKDGDMTHAQAASLHKDDRQIRGEERSMASQNGGHITKGEKQTLNQQENGVSKQIGPKP